MSSTSHQDAYQDINPVNLVGQKIQFNNETKTIKEINGGLFEDNTQLTVKFKDGTEKQMSEIPIEKLEAAT